MSSLNEVNLLGNVGKDPEIRRLNNGGKVANFSIATSEKWKDKSSGEWKERTEWHRIVVWGDGLVEKVIDPHVKKGTKLFVKGKLQTRKWTDQSGAEKYSTEVVVSGFDGQVILCGGNGNGGGNSASRANSDDAYTTSFGRSSADAAVDDDIPF